MRKNDKMQILVVNDDGYTSEGIRILAEFAGTLGNVTLCAPKTEQSGKSHAINITSPFEAKRAEPIGGAECWYVDSTPADCVRFAVNGLHREYDLVFSGINRGINVGRDILYSGTVGAIFEAAALGMPAIAFSTEPGDFGTAKEKIPAVYAWMAERGLLAGRCLWNINIPKVSPKGILLTRQAGPYYLDRIEPCGDGLFRQIGYSMYQGTADLSLDLDAVMNGYISITPMSLSRTDEKVLHDPDFDKNTLQK